MLAAPLGQLLISYAIANATEMGSLHFDAVIGVPMFPAKQRRRGYNQADRLARAVARGIDLPYRTGLLRRTRATRPQVGLSLAERSENVEEAFRGSPQCLGLSLLLIDDVSTTGSTLKHASKAAKAAGAKSVYCLTLAAG